MKIKAEKPAQWAIGITVSYFTIFILSILFINGSADSVVGSVLTGFCFYFTIPLLIADWILSIWSLRLEKKNIGYWALFITIIYSVLFVGFSNCQNVLMIFLLIRLK